MDKVYQVLLIEDDESDSDLIGIELDKLDIELEVEVIFKEQQLVDRLETDPPDLVISDYNLPSLNGTEALRIVREQYPHLPFILVSGFIGEEKAVDAMLEGASDYAMKSNLSRLGPAVLREISNYDEYRQRSAELNKTRNRYESLVQSVNGIVWEADAETFEFSFVSPQSQELLGYSPEEWLDKPNFWQNHIHPDDRREAINFCHYKTQQGKNHSFEYRMLDANDEIVWLRDYVTVITDDGEPVRIRGLMLDISKEKIAEQQRDKAYEIADIGHWELDLKNEDLYWSETVKDLHEVDPDYDPDLDSAINFYKEGEHRRRIRNAVENTIKKGDSFDVELKIITANNNERWVRAVGEAEFRNGECVRIYGSTQDITQRKEIEQKLRDIVEHSTNMFYRHSPDHVLTYVSPQSHEYLGCSPEEAKRYWTEFVTDHPINEKGFKSTQKAIDTGESQPSFQLQLQKKTGEKIWVRVNEAPIVENGETIAIVGSLTDITKQKETQQQIKKTNEKLKAAQQIAQLGYWEYRFESDEIYWSDQSYRIWEYDPAEETITEDMILERMHPDDKERYTEEVNKVREDKTPLDIEHRILLPDGRVKWIHVLGDIKYYGDNKVLEGTAQDITEKKKRQQKLKDSLERYEYVTKATDDVVYDWDIKKDILEWDDSFREKFKYDISKGEYTIDYWAENVHPEDIKKTRESLQNVLSDTGQSKWENEYRFKKKDGTYATVFERGFIIRNGSGDAVRMIGSLQDITERIKYQEELEDLALVASKTTDVIIITDVQDRITWVNDAFENLTGYSYNEAIGKNPGELLQGSETDRNTAEHLGEAVREQKSVQDVILNYSKDGTKYWLDITIDPIFDDEGNCEGFIAIEKDATEQIERQRELQESVDRYDIVSKATSDTIWDLNLETDTVRYNSNIYNTFGYEKQEVDKPADWWRDKLHPEDYRKVMSQIQEALEADSDRFQMEYRFQCADGSYKYIYDRAFIVNDEQENPIRMIGAMQDVTQQREEQKWLQLFQSAIANTREAVAIIESEPTELPGRKILYVNQAFCDMTGYAAEEAKGETLNILNGPKTSQEKRDELRDKMEKWESCEIEFLNYRKNGEEFWVRVSMTPVEVPHNAHFWVSVGREITEEKKREKELRESLNEKETLLLEIHHRVKNNLAVVSGMMQLQAFEEEDETFRKKLLNSITRIQSMGNIHELLYQSESFTELAFHENLRKLTNQIIDTLRIDVDLQTHFDLNEVNLNINQAIPCSLIANEVITNVIKHAFTGRKHGQLTISMSEVDGKIYLTFEDNGVGLPPDFGEESTKQSLGLKLIDTLAKQLGANYEYTSLDNGTKFCLQFEKANVKGSASAHLM